MPHISLKMYKGRTKEEKDKIANELAEVLVKNGVKPTAISVSVTDYEPEVWKEQVYDKEIRDNKDIFVEAGYKM